MKVIIQLLITIAALEKIVRKEGAFPHTEHMKLGVLGRYVCTPQTVCTNAYVA